MTGTAKSPTWRSPFSAIALIVVLAAGGPAAAQTGEPPSPAEEPSSAATLFDQSDLGNVAQPGRWLRLGFAYQMK